KIDRPLGLFLDGLASVKQRKILPIAPHPGQVAVVRVIRIAGLAGMIYSPRVVPVTNVDYHAHRRSVDLPEVSGLVRRLAGHEGAAIFLDRADIDLCTAGFVNDPGEGMFAEIVMQLAPLPLLCIRALQLFHLLVSRTKTR